MRYKCYDHRNGLFLCRTHRDFKTSWTDLRDVLDSITDADLMKTHRAVLKRRSNCKSLSAAINLLIRERLEVRGWEAESPIFKDASYQDPQEKCWRLDFANDIVSVEVAFNHGEAIAWNLLKPTLAGELNHVDKNKQTRLGIVIGVTDAMKCAGNFDNAVGSWEKMQKYLPTMMDHLTVPMVIVGLEAPEVFRIGTKKEKKSGRIIRLRPV